MYKQTHSCIGIDVGHTYGLKAEQTLRGDGWRRQHRGPKELHRNKRTK